MKRKALIISCFIAAAIVISFGIWNYNYEQKKKQLADEYEINLLYYHQNYAFGLGHASFEDKKFYRGSDELDLQLTALRLHVYNLDQSTYVVTLQEVVDYLSEEYAEDGSLKILSRPESITSYIDWYSRGGDEEILKYRVEIAIYLSDNGYADSYNDISVEELQEMMDKYDKETERR